MSPAPTHPSPVIVDPAILASVGQGLWHDPHAVLGAHPGEDGLTIRVLAPYAEAVSVVWAGGTVPTVHELEGVWVGVLPSDVVVDYQVSVTYNGVTTLRDDPYRHLPTVHELDRHLLREGRHERLWEVLGANLQSFPSSHGTVDGTGFAVWAPNARSVRVIGDFNHWDGRNHAMRTLGASGVWELFIPGVGAGDRYKFEIITHSGARLQKADPLAKATEVPPATASVVTSAHHGWSDDAWLDRRASRDPHTGALSIYEVHLGSWRPGLSYRDLATELTEYVTSLGFTHVEFLPVAEHPFGGSWGYQVTSYYAPTSRFGSPDDFRFLVDALHQAGIGVILDWVPAHFPKDEWALGRFDGTCLYEHPDPRRGDHPDWGTYVFDFGRAEVRNFLVANALYWFEEFHIDALRVDAVASMLYLDYSRKAGEWVPNSNGGRENLDAINFLQETCATAYREHPGIMMIAEESTAWAGVTAPTSAGGLGFGLKWNMGWMNDTLRYLAEAPINRRYHHHELTFSMVYAYSERFVLPISHDEVVHGKGSLLRKFPGNDWEQFAGLRGMLAYQWTHPGKNLLFMGCEFAQGTEWSEQAGLEWYVLDYAPHRGVQRLVKDLNSLYRTTPALWELDHEPRGFEWLDSDDADHNVLAYLRRDASGRPVVIAVNFSGTTHTDIVLPFPHSGEWLEALNTDAAEYGGAGVGNLGVIHANDVPRYGRPASAAVQLPAFAAVVFVPAATD